MIIFFTFDQLILQLYFREHILILNRQIDPTYCIRYMPTALLKSENQKIIGLRFPLKNKMVFL